MIPKIGTAGWTIPRTVAARFPAAGTALERYSSRFNATEINSSFHRPHRASTWARWADSVPDDFRFSAKLPKTITHQARLVQCADVLGEFLDQVSALGDKLGVLLVQLPPKLEFDPVASRAFFRDLGARSPAAITCEPRNASWFTDEAQVALAELRVARVAADPALSPEAARPGGWSELAYWRLHGSPVIYRSTYSDRIESLADEIAAASPPERWCVFDNTASSAATPDAMALGTRLGALSELAIQPTVGKNGNGGGNE